MAPLLYILTCPSREEAFAETMRQLGRSDWGADVRVCIHAGMLDGNAVAAGHLGVLKRALDEGPEWFLVIEDDLLINRWLRHNLLCWQPLREGTLQLGSLYNSGLPLEPNASIQPRPVAARKLADPRRFIGSQARVFSRECARLITQKMTHSGLRQDLRMATIASELGPIWVHAPSLVQHVGLVSTWGGLWHEARDYDADWRASDASPQDCAVGNERRGVAEAMA